MKDPSTLPLYQVDLVSLFCGLSVMTPVLLVVAVSLDGHTPLSDALSGALAAVVATWVHKGLWRANIPVIRRKKSG